MPEMYKKILLIDDDEKFLNELSKYLTLRRFQVNIAKSGKHGLELRKHLHFDIIITDLQMEGMSGLDVINMVTKTYPDTNIFVVSGFIDDEKFKEIKSIPNIKAIYKKPIELEKLANKIEECI